MRRPFKFVLASLSWRLLLALAVPVLLLSVSVSAASASPWFSSFTSSTSEEQQQQQEEESQDKEWVSPIVNRELEASVVAHAWPFTHHNVACEGLAHYSYKASTSDDNDAEEEHSTKDTDRTPSSSSTSIHAKSYWNFVEAWVTHLEGLAEDDLPTTASQVTQHVLQAASSMDGTTAAHHDDPASLLLSYGLALRANSPQCELHRGLARRLLLTTLNPSSSLSLLSNPNNSTLSQQWQHIDAFVHVRESSQQDRILLDPAELASLSKTSGLAKHDLLLRGEVPSRNNKQQQQDNDDDMVVILYANLASRAFCEFYRALLVLEPDISFVLRHLGHVWYEEETDGRRGGVATPTVLQGYGVRLDIRNVEYRVFDDRRKETNDKAAQQQKQHLTEVNVSSVETMLTHQYLAGVNQSAWGGNDLELQSQLWKMHEAQQIQSQLVPPKWQRRQLSLQAATAIVGKSRQAGSDAATTKSPMLDPLLVLQDVSQNLPSVASTLVHMTVAPDIQEWAAKLRPLHQDAALYVNGRKAPINRPSFNVFELLRMLQDEQEAVSKLQEQFRNVVSFPALQAIQRAWIMGPDALLKEDEDEDESDNGSDDGTKRARNNDKNNNNKMVRVDVGRGWKQAVVYINDVEKDPRYRQWPRQVKQALMAMQFGAPPSVRRNLFTVLVVVDPLEDSAAQNAGLLLGMQLMQQSFPVRLGALLVNQDDLDECASWVASTKPDQDVPCPVQPLFAKAVSASELDSIPATTQALHKMFAHVCLEHGDSGVAAAYLEYLLPAVEQSREQKGGAPLTMGDLLSVHVSLMAGMGLFDAPEAKSEAFRILTQDDKTVEDFASYGKALRFALSKKVGPGMSFLNGRPLPTGQDEGSQEKVGQVFMEEQSHVFQLIMANQINDNSPKSVYAMLLSGDHVYKWLHPLLTDSGNSKDAYLTLDHGYGPESLIFPALHPTLNEAEAVFVVEGVFDLDSAEGRNLANSFLTTMDAFSSSLGDDESATTVSLAYRVLPSTVSKASQALCAFFSKADSFEITNLKSFLDLYSTVVKSAGEVIDSFVDASNDLRQAIKSQESGICRELSFLETSLPSKNFITANGRLYSLDDAPLDEESLELLLTMELKKTKAVTKLLSPHLSFQDASSFDAVAATSAFLAQAHADGQKRRSDVQSAVLDIEKSLDAGENPLRFSWNDGDAGDVLKVQITAVADPVTESTQRMAPLLRALRDHLRLPISLIIVPRLPGDLDNDDSVPITSYYRFVAEPLASPDMNPPKAYFSNLPTNHILTLRMDVPEPWNVQQSYAVQDTDNLRCDVESGCSDEAHEEASEVVAIENRRDLTHVEYDLKSLLIFGQCYDATTGSPPNGLQLTLSEKPVVDLQSPTGGQKVEIGPDGSVIQAEGAQEVESDIHFSDTLVMKNVGYWQLQAYPGVWNLNIAPDSRGAEIFDMAKGRVVNRKIKLAGKAANNSTKTIVLKDFVNRGEFLLVKRRPGYEKATLFYKSDADKEKERDEKEVINVFSLATGHLYERFLKIMMLSVTKRTSSRVKFWLFENFLSPNFKASAIAMAERIGCDVEFVTYKWPEWVRGQREKQRIIWGYKILFLDVLFPLGVRKVIYVDADQVVRGDLKELWDMDLQGAPYGYTPFCTSRETTLGFQFWRSGFWKNHLRDKPYHISALYVVDLERFRRDLVGDQLRSMYQQLSADPNSLANLDQDLPNYAQTVVPIFSLPQEWLWCETWCSDETKATAKTIDLCNNPLHKEPKVSMAKRIISGELFNESWVELDAEVERYEKEYRASLQETNSE